MLNKGTPNTPSASGTQLPSHRPYHYIRNGLVFMALGLFATAAALAVVRPNLETEAPMAYQARQTISLPTPLPEPLSSFSSPFVSETQIRRGDTLAALLQRLNVQAPELQTFLVHNEEARSIYKLYPGRTIQAAVNSEGELQWLRYNHTPGTSEKGQFVSKWLEVRPDQDGGYTATEHAQAADMQIRMAEGEISSSLFGATDAAGIPDAITIQMADILSSKIDFLRDLRQGDRFRIVYETHSYNGKEIGSGRVLALEFNNKDKAYEAVWFAPKQASGSYYDFDGRSLKGAFLRTSLKFSRISSTFGMRKHPVHGGWRGHKGVDYAAQTNTPIHATADGTVDFIGRQNGYGNVIVLKHHGQYTTLYAHQNKFAKGLKKGDRVEQGQLIGYVGSTGWATGPHLHYEFRVANKPVDPLSVDLPVARKLEGADRKEFDRAMAGYQQQIQWLAQLQDQDVQLASR